MKPLSKINEQGLYTNFPGVTVIAFLKDDSLKQALYTALYSSSLICDYFSPLPAASYHVTTCNLFTEKEQGQVNWEGFLTDKHRLFQTVIEDVASMPDVLNGKIDGILSSGALQLKISFDEATHAQLTSFGNRLQLSSNVPNPFHVTLAYQYKPIENEQRLAIQTALTNALNGIFQSHCYTITLQRPTLCYFPSMGKFIPWNGQTSPFATKDKHLLFFNKTVNESSSSDLSYKTTFQ